MNFFRNFACSWLGLTLFVSLCPSKKCFLCGEVTLSKVLCIHTGFAWANFLWYLIYIWAGIAQSVYCPVNWSLALGKDREFFFWPLDTDQLWGWPSLLLSTARVHIVSMKRLCISDRLEDRKKELIKEGQTFLVAFFCFLM